MRKLLCLLLLAALPAIAADELHLYNWNDYIAPESVKEFVGQCKCKVVQDFYGDNEELVAKLAAGAKGYDVMVPTGVNRPSWEILLNLVGISSQRLYQEMESFGHTIMADSFLLLEDLRRRNRVASGSRLLLFSYGFGSSWSALLLEH